MTSGVGHKVARLLGIQLQPKDPYHHVNDPRETAHFNTDQTFVEESPRVDDFFLKLVPSGPQVWRYLVSLFPFLSWIGYYNLQWLAGDLVAGKELNAGLLNPVTNQRTGITIGAVVVPQGMAYARLANLDVQFGLYSSFMGVLVYWFFATSKDITIGVSASKARLGARLLTL